MTLSEEKLNWDQTTSWVSTVISGQTGREIFKEMTILESDLAKVLNTNLVKCENFWITQRSYGVSKSLPEILDFCCPVHTLH
jgi:hypothetical protein